MSRPRPVLASHADLRFRLLRRIGSPVVGRIPQETWDSRWPYAWREKVVKRGLAVGTKPGSNLLHWGGRSGGDGLRLPAHGDRNPDRSID